MSNPSVKKGGPSLNPGGMGWWMGLIFGLIIFHSWPLFFLIPFVVSLIGWILEYLQH